jgi:hypothetical protein
VSETGPITDGRLAGSRADLHRAAGSLRRAGGSSALAAVVVLFCLAEVTAGLAVTMTTGAVQMILTVFVVAAPLLVGGAAGYALLATRTPVAAAAGGPLVTALPMTGPTHTALAAAEYSALAHHLLGVLDALRQELPAAADRAMIKRPASLHVSANLSLDETVLGSARHARAAGDVVPRVTVGSVLRAAAALKYPLLSEDWDRSQTRRAIQKLSSDEPNYFFAISVDGTIRSLLNLNELDDDAIEQSAGEEGVLLLQVLSMMQGQLIIAFIDDENALVRPGARLTQFVKGMRSISLPLDPSALVISDGGDLYGTLADVLSRHEPADQPFAIS